MWARLKEVFFQKSQSFREKISSLWTKPTLTPEEWDALEEEFISWDFGVALSHQLCTWLQKQKIPHPIPENYHRTLLAQHLLSMLQPYEKKLSPQTFSENGTPWVLLVMGSNGCGKTTLLGKLGHMWAQQGYTVRLGAADTFRAAAPEQLAGWAEQSNLSTTIGHEGEDPASVVFRTLQDAQHHKNDVVLMDTAGRLSNKTDLLQELEKIHRIIQRHHEKYSSHELYERVLVLDATTGHNTLIQVEVFGKIIPLSGIIMNKMDGTAKGGMVFALTHTFHTPVIGFGSGEKKEDFAWFHAKEFVDTFL